MNTIIFICKGILFYITVITVVLWLCGIDSILEQGYFIPWTLIMIILIAACYKFLSFDDINKLTFNKK